MRARKKTWTKNELDTNEKMIHGPEDFKGKWRDYFQNDNPIHLEIGCGKGRFITQMALQNPGINFIALEKEPHVIVSGTRCAREIHCQLAFIVGDAQDLASYFEAGEVQRIYINFCDPWTNKRKWEKRRLTYATFLNLYASIFGGNGDIYFKTDNQALFEFSLNEFCENNWHLKNITLDLHKSDYCGNVMTEYEEKFSAQGLPIYRCEASIGVPVVPPLILETHRLLLRPFIATDETAFATMTDQAHVVQWMPDWTFKIEPPCFHKKDASIFFAITLAEENKPIGMVGIFSKKDLNNEIEICYLVSGERENSGYASEAVAAVTHWALETLNIDMVMALVTKDNVSSQRVLEKSGYLLQAIRNIRLEGETEEKPYCYYKAFSDTTAGQ